MTDNDVKRLREMLVEEQKAGSFRALPSYFLGPFTAEEISDLEDYISDEGVVITLSRTEDKFLGIPIWKVEGKPNMYHEDHLATEAEADKEWVMNTGHENADRCWILSDRDCWYRNPFYTGPVTPHPESD